MISKFKTIVVVVLVIIPSIIMAQMPDLCRITLDSAQTTPHFVCHGDSTGAITVDVASSPATTLYFWTGPLGFSSVIEDISGLLAGDYQLIVNDISTSCSDTFNYTIKQPRQITADFTLFGLCETGDSADVSTFVDGGTPYLGTPRYTYLWSTGGTTVSTTNLAPG